MTALSIEALNDMNRAALAATWTRLCKGKPLPAVGDAVLRLALAYRLQASHLASDLSAAVERQLRQALSGPAARRKSKAIRFQRYLREWNGEMHIVEKSENGFTYRDADYRSLSEIARKITGTRWSDPLFFGAKKRGQTTSEGVAS